MNVEMAYLLGMITGNGEVQRNNDKTTILIEIPHKKLQTEFQTDVRIYVKASITDIRNILEPLMGTGISFIQNKNVSYLSFSKSNEDYLMREILRYLNGATSTDNMRISPEVFSFTLDERKYFIKGFADVTGYIRSSNYAYYKPQYRVYFEIPNNWYLVIDFCNLLKSIDIPVQAIDWGHPNMRDGKLKKYNEGNLLFWKKEHQVKLWALEYQKIGFVVLHKQQALDFFAKEHERYLAEKKTEERKRLHRYYWEVKQKKQNKPMHPGETNEFIPEQIRGKHYNSWSEIAKDLGYGCDE